MALWHNLVEFLETLLGTFRFRVVPPGGWPGRYSYHTAQWRSSGFFVCIFYLVSENLRGSKRLWEDLLEGASGFCLIFLLHMFLKSSNVFIFNINTFVAFRLTLSLPFTRSWRERRWTSSSANTRCKWWTKRCKIKKTNWTILWCYYLTIETSTQHTHIWIKQRLSLLPTPKKNITPRKILQMEVTNVLYAEMERGQGYMKR